jgi:putative ABC transport system permease protein
MKFMPLVWAGLWRRPVRTILTAGSIVIAFVLLGLLQGVNTGFDRAIAAANRNFGGLLPAIRAARANIAERLRED